MDEPDHDALTPVMAGISADYVSRPDTEEIQHPAGLTIRSREPDAVALGPVET